MELVAGGLQPDGEVRPAAAPASANEARNESDQGGDRVSSTVG